MIAIVTAVAPVSPTAPPNGAPGIYVPFMQTEQRRPDRVVPLVKFGGLSVDTREIICEIPPSAARCICCFITRVSQPKFVRSFSALDGAYVPFRQAARLHGVPVRVGAPLFALMPSNVTRYCQRNRFDSRHVFEELRRTCVGFRTELA